MACVGDCYNLTTLTAANETLAVVDAVNDLSGDWWARLFLIGLFGMIFILSAIKTGEGLKGAVAGGFITTITAFLFLAADLVSNTEPYLCLIGTVVLTLILYAGGTPK